MSLEIAVLNESTKITDDAVQAMLGAFETQWNRDLASIWGNEQAGFEFIPKGNTPPPDAWQLVFLDNSDQAGALAYHDLTAQGLPLSKVFVETILEAKDSVSVGASHELCEMAIDPWLCNAFQDPNGAFWAAECADPCEDQQFGYLIDNVLVTDFVTPAWFGVRGAHKFDFMGHCPAAWSVLQGGYAQHFDHSKGWVEVEGAMLKPYFQRMLARNRTAYAQRSAPRR